MARKVGIKADMVAASIDINHLIHKKVVERIEKRNINEVIKMGYKNIWFVSVSLDALNPLLFYKKHEKVICGDVALAPYLGDKVLTKELSKMDSMNPMNKWKPTVLVKNKGV